MAKAFDNWFNFYPVGQGLFYAGVLFDGFSFVYDCGTETAGVNINNYIKHLKSYVPSGTLDFLAISHFHKDHISGVKDLINNFQVDKIIVPYICRDITIRIVISAIIMSYSMTDDEVLSLVDFLYSNESGANWEQSSDGSYHYEIVLDFRRFDFFAKTIANTQYTRFKNDYDNLLVAKGCKDILELISHGFIGDVQKIYEGVFGKGNKLNETSVVMLHQPVIDIPYDCVVCSIPYSSVYQSVVKYVAPTSLLTGDAMIDSSMAVKINALINNTDVGIAQVPHHGSYKNWFSFKSLINNGNTIYLIPCGTHNRYRLPSKQTLKDLNGHEFYKVTEFVGYPYWITIII